MIKNIRKLRGGSTPAPTTQNQTNAPWAVVQPYLKGSYQQAANLYSQGPDQYTPWSQVANLNQDQLAQFNGVEKYVNDPSNQQFMKNASQANQGLMDGSSNPYAPITNQTNQALAGYLQNNNGADVGQGLNHFMYQNTQDPGLQQNITQGVNQAGNAYQNASGQVQNHFGVGSNVAQNTGDMSRNFAVNSAFNNAFDVQNQNRSTAAGMANDFANKRAGLAANLNSASGDWLNNAKSMGYQYYQPTMNAPLGLLGQLNLVGGAQQAQNQSLLSDATNRWNFDQQAQQQALARYNAFINPNASWGTTNTSAVQGVPGVSGSQMGSALGSAAGMVAGSYYGGSAGGAAGAGLGAAAGGAAGSYA